MGTALYCVYMYAMQAANASTAAIWKAETYNSLPSCGSVDLQQKALAIQQAFEAYGKGSVKFTSAKPSSVKCPTQVNGSDCGMCIAGFALTIALGCSVWDAPTEYLPSLRSKWHACIADALQHTKFALLDSHYLHTVYDA